VNDNNIKVIVIGGSAGSFPVVNQILASIPVDFKIPIVLCLHRLKHVRHGFVEALNTKSKKIVVEPDDKQKMLEGGIYLAPSNYHLFAGEKKTFSLSTDEMVKYSRPSIDLTFETFANMYGQNMLGIIITGANSDGADGLFKAFKRNSRVIAQDPNDATIRTMPDAAIKLMPNIEKATVTQIIKIITSLK
jgi:two-component system, chemotaxis family, protein-glutamate methylesterase/glutaminase